MSASARVFAFAVLLTLPAVTARAEAEALFPPATEGCYVGAEVTPVAAGATPYRKPPLPVTAVRLERGYPQLAREEKRPPKDDRLISLRVIATFADAGKRGVPKRFANGMNDLLSCTADLCDANNYKVERQADGAVLLRMTGGLYVGGGAYPEVENRNLPDGHVYRLVASPMSACR